MMMMLGGVSTSPGRFEKGLPGVKMLLLVGQINASQYI